MVGGNGEKPERARGNDLENKEVDAAHKALDKDACPILS